MQQTNTQVRRNLISIEDTAILFIDHQSAFVETVESTPLETLRNSVAALAMTATALGVPVIATQIDPGKNGTILPEIFEHAPNAVLVSRNFEINSWDSADFIRAVKATGKKTLIISGLWTSVCATFPAISATLDGFTVCLVTDASGDISREAHQNAIDRCIQNDIIPVSANSIIAELQHTWDRPDADTFRKIYARIIPRFQVILDWFPSA